MCDACACLFRRVIRLDDHCVGWGHCLCAGRMFIYTSGLDPHHVGVGAIACIYLLDSVGRSTISLAISWGRPMVYLGQGRLDSQPCRGLVPNVMLSIETGTDRYTQVQSMEENEIGLP